MLVFSTFLAASQDENDRSRLQDLTVPYWVCIALAMLISLISLGYRVFEWWTQVRTRVRTARHMGIETQPTRREALLAKIAVAKQTCMAHILAFSVAVFEDIPMGTLTVMFTVRMYQLPIAVVLSLVTTCIMLGMKLNKLTLLKYWYAIAALRLPRPRCRCILCTTPQVGQDRLMEGKARGPRDGRCSVYTSSARGQGQL
jgi:hypothetical protein